jgi:hypothetical protein
MNLRQLVVLGVLLVPPSLMAAQTGKKIYLDPNDSFSAYFSSALHKKQVPVTVTVDPKQADYTATFQARGSDGSIIQGILQSMGKGNYDNRSFNEVVMNIVDVRTKDVVFSYTCSKTSQYQNASSALATSVAECLAKHWKDNLH